FPGPPQLATPRPPMPGFPLPALAHPLVRGPHRGTEISPRGPRVTPSASALDPDYPGAEDVAQETLGNRWGGFLPPFRYSCRHSHFPRLHGWLTPPLHGHRNALLPRDRPEGLTHPQLR